MQENLINCKYFTGDGRMDSPGHCAQYCTYTFMENNSKKVISVKTMDKRETERKSANLEKLGFIRGMQDVRERGLQVKEVVTDAHLQIGAMMSKFHFKEYHSPFLHLLQSNFIYCKSCVSGLFVYFMNVQYE